VTITLLAAGESPNYAGRNQRQRPIQLRTQITLRQISTVTINVVGGLTGLGSVIGGLRAATTKRRRVVGSLVAAAVVAGTMGVPVPALAAGGPKPADYATQASKAADYI
jgi:hypothetical protein